MTDRDYRKEAQNIPDMPFKTDFHLFEDMLDEIDRLRAESLEWRLKAEQFLIDSVTETEIESVDIIRMKVKNDLKNKQER